MIFQWPIRLIEVFYGQEEQGTAAEQKVKADRNKRFQDLVHEVLQDTCRAQPVPVMNISWATPGVLFLKGMMSVPPKKEMMLSLKRYHQIRGKNIMTDKN